MQIILIRCRGNRHNFLKQKQQTKWLPNITNLFIFQNLIFEKVVIELEICDINLDESVEKKKKRTKLLSNKQTKHMLTKNDINLDETYKLFKLVAYIGFRF